MKVAIVATENQKSVATALAADLTARGFVVYHPFDNRGRRNGIAYPAYLEKTLKLSVFEPWFKSADVKILFYSQDHYPPSDEYRGFFQKSRGCAWSIGICLNSFDSALVGAGLVCDEWIPFEGNEYDPSLGAAAAACLERAKAGPVAKFEKARAKAAREEYNRLNPLSKRLKHRFGQWAWWLKTRPRVWRQAARSRAQERKLAAERRAQERRQQQLQDPAYLMAQIFDPAGISRGQPPRLVPSIEIWGHLERLNEIKPEWRREESDARKKKRVANWMAYLTADAFRHHLTSEDFHWLGQNYPDTLISSYWGRKAYSNPYPYDDPHDSTALRVYSRDFVIDLATVIHFIPIERRQSTIYKGLEEQSKKDFAKYIEHIRYEELKTLLLELDFARFNHGGTAFRHIEKMLDDWPSDIPQSEWSYEEREHGDLIYPPNLDEWADERRRCRDIWKAAIDEASRAQETGGDVLQR